MLCCNYRTTMWPTPPPHRRQRAPLVFRGATIRPRKPCSFTHTITIIAPEALGALGAWQWAGDRRMSGILPKRFCIRWPFWPQLVSASGLLPLQTQRGGMLRGVWGTPVPKRAIETMPPTQVRLSSFFPNAGTVGHKFDVPPTEICFTWMASAPLFAGYQRQ